MTRFELSYEPPLDWPALLAFLQRRAAAGVEFVDDTTYRRTATFGNSVGVLEVSRAETPGRLSVSVSESLSAHKDELSKRLRRLFDLDLSPRSMHESLGSCEELGDIVASIPGLRAPGAWEGLEIGVRAIVGQQRAANLDHYPPGSGQLRAHLVIRSVRVHSRTYVT